MDTKLNYRITVRADRVYAEVDIFAPDQAPLKMEFDYAGVVSLINIFKGIKVAMGQKVQEITIQEPIYCPIQINLSGSLSSSPPVTGEFVLNETSEEQNGKVTAD